LRIFEFLLSSHRAAPLPFESLAQCNTLLQHAAATYGNLCNTLLQHTIKQ